MDQSMSSASGGTEVQKADPRAQRLAAVGLICGLVVGALLIIVAPRLRPEFDAWVREDPETRLRLVLAGLGFVAIAPLFAVAAYLWELSRRIVRSGRYPPPGLRLIKDVPVVTGAAAAHRARLVRTAAGILMSAGLVLGFLFWRLAVVLNGDQR
jgi:hypothetical protein